MPRYGRRQLVFCSKEMGMSADTNDERSEYVARAESRIRRHLSRSLDVHHTEVVDDPELQPEGAQLSDTDAIILVGIRHPENDDVLGDLSRGSAEQALYDHVESQLFNVDGFIVESSIPPERAVNQSCLFYIQVAL